MKWGVLILAMTLGLMGCGGGEEPGEPPAPAPEEAQPEGGIEPPGDPDMDLDPDRPTGTEWQIQQNNITSSTDITYQLSPLAFGKPLCFWAYQSSTTNPPTAITAISMPFGDYELTASIDGAGEMQYSVKDGNGVDHPVSAYDPAQHGNNNFLWPSILMDMSTAQGYQVTLTVDGNSVPVAIPASQLAELDIWWTDPNDPNKKCE